MSGTGVDCKCRACDVGARQLFAFGDRFDFLIDLRLFYQKGQFSRVAFLKESPSHFTRAVRKCLASAKPVKEPDRDSYSALCGEEIFTFEKVDGAYKFTHSGVND